MKHSRGMTRRDLLKTAALAAPALSGLPHLLAAEESKPPAKDERGPLKVIVVGAGLAGLAAAHELVTLGHAVTVLEAQKRPGGRVHTLREPFADGLYAEAGAIDFSGGARHVMRYVKAFGLPIRRRERVQKSVYHMRGQRITVNWGENPKEPDWPFKLSAEEKSLGINGAFQKYFGIVDKIGDPCLPEFKPEAWKALDQVSLTEYLKRQGASDEAVELLSYLVPWGYGWSKLSALHRLISDACMFYIANYQAVLAIDGGNDLLPAAMAKSLGERVRYGAAVTRILQQPGHVRAVFQEGGKEQWLDADRLVCAVPCPVLGKFTFAPELPAEKRRILEKLEYNPVTRIFLQSRNRFWREAGEIGDLRTDLPIRLVTEHPFGNTKKGRGILESHLRGTEQALPMSSRPLPEQLAFAVEHMDKAYPGFKEHYETGTSFSWHTDPWAGGGYPVWKPGQLTEWMPELAKPSGRIHFAGEHTSWLSRTMEGAFESGNRAAREVHEAPRPISPHAG